MMNSKEKLKEKISEISNSEFPLIDFFNDIGWLEGIKWFNTEKAYEDIEKIYNVFTYYKNKCKQLEIANKNNEGLVRDNVKLMNRNLKLQDENAKLKQDIASLELDTCIPQLRKENEKLKFDLQTAVCLEVKNAKECAKLKQAISILKEKLDIKLEIYHSGGCTLNHKIIPNCVTSNERCLRYLEVEEYGLLKEVLEND